MVIEHISDILVDDNSENIKKPIIFVLMPIRSCLEMNLRDNHITAVTKLAMVLCLFLMAIQNATATPAGDLHSVWSELLGRHVSAGVVDYQAMKKKENRLDEYLAILDATDPQQLQKAERLAFYINAYNAYTVKLILINFENGRPVKSIKDIGGLFSGPWDIKLCRIGGKVYTLDNIEHDIIRPIFKDPRVHFAVNCASQSCPPLISEAYVGSRLDDQLQANTINFINNKEFNRLDGSTLYVSKIFKWFSEDFNDDIVAFFRQYAQGDLQSRLLELGDDITVKYLDYDWSLNNN